MDEILDSFTFKSMKSQNVFRKVDKIFKKGDNAGYQLIFLFIRPSKTGRIMGSPMAGGRAASSSLSGAYLQSYSS